MDVLIVTARCSERKADLCTECFRRNMPQHSVSIFGSKDTYSLTDKTAKFVDENSVIDHGVFFGEFKAIYPNAISRANWYYQQFIKLGYSMVTDASEYVVFDCDTFPLRDIPFKHDNRYCFNRKSEHHIPYFNTMKRLFDGLVIEHRSFISEYMAMNTEIVKEMIAKISSIDRDKPWYTTVLKAIDASEVAKSGFAEYETYGTYISTFHGDMVENIEIPTKRDGRTMFDCIPTYDDIMKHSDTFATISIENW